MAVRGCGGPEAPARPWRTRRRRRWTPAGPLEMQPAACAGEGTRPPAPRPHPPPGDKVRRGRGGAPSLSAQPPSWVFPFHPVGEGAVEGGEGEGAAPGRAGPGGRGGELRQRPAPPSGRSPRSLQPLRPPPHPGTPCAPRAPRPGRHEAAVSVRSRLLRGRAWGGGAGAGGARVLPLPSLPSPRLTWTTPSFQTRERWAGEGTEVGAAFGGMEETFGETCGHVVEDTWKQTGTFRSI